MIIKRYIRNRHISCIFFVFTLLFMVFIIPFKITAQEVLDNIITRELTREQSWAIALTGILSELNRSNNNTLSTSWSNYRYRAVWLEVLRRDWGITTKEELLETLDNIENGRHSASLREIQLIIYEVSTARNDSEALAILNKYPWDQTKINRFNYVVQNWEVYYNRTIRAWDLGRNISLCRWGFDVGFFTEDEAWEKIMYYAKIIQPLYNSWEEYGYDYLMGCLFFASGLGEPSRYQEDTIPIYERLISRNGLWYNREWSIDLN